MPLFSTSVLTSRVCEAYNIALGHLEAKRSTLNPNFAALMVRYFREAGLQRGDVVAIGASGSFPGLMVATLCACEEMGLEARAIASFGASMYGATRIEFSLPKIVRLLNRAGIVDCDLLAVSPGGNDDRGESVLFADAREIIARLAKEEGVEFIDYDDLEKSIARRLELFGEDVDCFVNVGGASANSGTSAYTLNFPNGLVMVPPRIPTTKNRGLMYEYAARGVPVIHLLNVRKLCQDHGLPYDPVPLPEPGEGGVYFDLAENRMLAGGAALLCVAILAIGRIRSQKRRYPEA